MPDVEKVKVIVPVAAGAPVAAESAWALPLGDGRHRIENVLSFTDGISFGDVVRCDADGYGHLVAVELVERSKFATVAFGYAMPDHGDAPGAEEHRRALEALSDALRGRFGDDLRAEGGMGFLSFAVTADRLGEVFDAATDAANALQGGGAAVDEDEHIVGPYLYTIVSHPDWSAPEPIPGADALLDATPPEPVDVSWEPDDPVASRWPAGLADRIVAVSRTSAERADLLESRRYLPLLVPEVRRAVIERFGFAAAGEQPFPLYPSSFDEGAWDAAKDDAGRVRYCRDDEADETFRAMLFDLGVDPDADPREATSPLA